MDQITEKLKAIKWQYAEKDLNALGIIRERIKDTGKKFGLISYSDLVKGVEFHYPNINGGKAYRIDTYDWKGLDRKILGECLGYISMESYLEAGFMASSLVIGRLESRPSDNFFEWMEYLKILPDMKEETVLKFWAEQVKKSHHWYKYGKQI